MIGNMEMKKKAFVGYCDWLSLVRMLSNEEAGLMFKHLLEYVNGNNPEFPEGERLLQIAFEPMKLQLERDFTKYQTIVTKRSAAGAKGGAPKGNINAAKTTKTSKTSKRLNKQAKQADTVTDTDTDTDTVTDIDVGIQQPPPTTEYDQNAVKDIDNLRAMAFADSIGFKEPICIHYKMKPETLNDWLNNFNTHLRRTGENRKQYKDYRKHFENWFRFQENRNEPAKWTYDKTPKQAATETTWEQALINNQKLLSKYD